MINPALVSNEAEFDARAFALRRRAEKKVAAADIGVDADFIDHMVESFYTAIREDDPLSQSSLSASMIGLFTWHG